MKTKFLPLTLLLLATMFGSSAFADTIYNVTSTGLLNCGPSGHHGLWTNNDIGGGSCSNYFDFQAGSTLTIHDSDADSANWTATLAATALNPYSVLAALDLTFSSYTDDHTAVDTSKTGGSPTAADIAAWIFFSDVAGTISVAGSGAYNINNLSGSTALQIGMGANDKTHTFGASAWLNSPDMSSGHWDINMDLSLASVPEPGLIGLLGLGLLTMGISNRRRRQLAAK